MRQKNKGELVLNKFEIERILGEGGNGIVYLAYETILKRYVALKEILPGNLLDSLNDKYQAAVKRLIREAELHAQFTGLPVITVYGLERDEEGQPILVMEYAENGSLLDLMQSRQNKPLDLTEFYPLAKDILNAVEIIHSHPLGIVHRDIKPSNILLTKQGARLADFGIAQLADETSYSSNRIDRHPGTLLYMSPEQERYTGYLDNRSDLYSIGLVFYEMLVGQRYKQSRVLPPSQLNPAIPPMLDYLIMRTLEEERENRYDSATEMLNDLEKAMRNETPPAPTITNRGRVSLSSSQTYLTQLETAKRKRRKPLIITLSLIMVLVLITSLGWFWWQNSTKSGVTGLPAGTVLFEDSFNGGIKPDWRPTNLAGDGRWAVDNGTYSLFDGFKGTTYAGTSEWDNYSLEVRITNLPRNSFSAELGQTVVRLRVQDENNYLALEIGSTRVQWLVMKDGKLTPLNRDPICRFAQCAENKTINLKIVLSGSNLYAYDNQQVMAKFEPTPEVRGLIPPKGYIGFRIEQFSRTTSPPQFDEVRVLKG